MPRGTQVYNVVHTHAYGCTQLISHVCNTAHSYTMYKLTHAHTRTQHAYNKVTQLTRAHSAGAPLLARKAPVL